VLLVHIFFYNGTFFERIVAHMGNSNPAKHEVKRVTFQRHIRRASKTAAFSEPFSWGFAGHVMPPTADRTPRGSPFPQMLP
jgi:hypothetical protein